MRRMLPEHLNPEGRRCAWCDKRVSSARALAAHEMEHRGSAEEMAKRLEKAAAIGLEHDVERGVRPPHRH